MAADDFLYTADGKEAIIRFQVGAHIDLVDALRRALADVPGATAQSVSVARVEPGEGDEYTEVRIRVFRGTTEPLRATRFIRD